MITKWGKSRLRGKGKTPQNLHLPAGERDSGGKVKHIGFLRKKVNITFSRKLPGGYSLYAARFSKNQITKRFFGWSETPMNDIYFYGGK